MASEYITVTALFCQQKAGLDEYQANPRCKIKIMLLEDHILRILSRFLK